jgi:hypothetical protein
MVGSIEDLLPPAGPGRRRHHPCLRPSLTDAEVAADAVDHLAGQSADSADTVALLGAATVVGELVGLGARWAVVTSADTMLTRTARGRGLKGPRRS